MHLAVLSALIAFFLKKPLGLKGASLAGGIFVIFYVYLAGAQASLVRSGLMYLLGSLSLWLCLKARVKILIALAFLIQIVFQSEAGMSLSFILSYLALAGILWIGEELNSLLEGKLPPFLGAGLSASAGAFIASAAVTAFFFGVLRPVGIAAGLALAPLAELFMILALGFLVCSFLFPFISYPLDLALSFLYRLQEGLASLAARVPGIAVSRAISALLLSLAAAAVILILNRRMERARRLIGPFA
jgi:competence protein ComEC